MDGGKAWPFFCFWLDWPEVGSESEPENVYGSSQMISVCLSCICRTVSPFWRPASLASSSSIHKLACANFLSAFRQWSLSAKTLFSAILTSSVRLLWWSLYHLTFLSDSEDALSSMWQTTVTPKTLSILTPNAVWEVHRLTAWEFCLALVELYIVHTLGYKISPWVTWSGSQGVEIWSI